MSTSVIFELNIQRSQDICRFNLAWGQGQKLPEVEVPYLSDLDNHYQLWQQAYLNYYSKALRAKPLFQKAGDLDPNYWRTQLRMQERQFLDVFNRWLRHENLAEIREIILTQGLSIKSTQSQAFTHPADIFLTCDSPDLERLPWEAWEILNANNVEGLFQLSRSAGAIRHGMVSKRKGKPRILILASEQAHLDLETDRSISQRYLKGYPAPTILGWGMSTSDVSELKQQFIDALNDPLGWDALLFFGHSDEGTLTGGELAIAPNTWIGIDEIKPHLLKAKENGLQFALFNSCNGLNIASSLVSLGMSQVIIMREKVHTHVAQQFLADFLGMLATPNNVHQAMNEAVMRLKTKHALEYPSAFLIPSIFRHRDSTPYQLPSAGWMGMRQRLKPTRPEVVALFALTLFSIFPPFQGLLLDIRLASQAVFRQITAQFPAQTSRIDLVMVDQVSLTKAKVPGDKYSPMDRSYLAKLIEKSSQNTGSIIGVDFLFDRPVDDDDAVLVQAFQKAVQRENWLVLATSLDQESGKELRVEVEGLSPNWSLEAHIDMYWGYADVPPPSPQCPSQCPLSYVLGLLQVYQTEQNLERVTPSLQSQTKLSEQVFSSIASQASGERLQRFSQPRSPFNLAPIVDFSIPPDQAYQPISAWERLESSNQDMARSQAPITLIVPGGYEGSDDVQPLPLATYFWQHQSRRSGLRLKGMPGGEAHAYMIHHWLLDHWVIPIPDLWMIGLAVLVGKGGYAIAIYRLGSQEKFWVILLGGVLVYGIFSLQILVSGQVLLPIFWPVVVISGYGIYLFQNERMPNT